MSGRGHQHTLKNLLQQLFRMLNCSSVLITKPLVTTLSTPNFIVTLLRVPFPSLSVVN